ncbi:helix-turn-helix domain-containing protein [Cupriavidus basilensis]|uniref:Helix-turn-helix domain-containing protein n=1 Tax=Cupriavidus basilensis TaxID=68895 RepID=A0ABT6AWY7_9BURK|nr:helix-turn-helix domain-containing protein [Cupriavidus basilensis]MDF3837130.1 helix-turn-helix domain-containing protein [Cupriavidus basilensis]
MSGKVSGLVFEFYPVGGGEMLTALCLADHADHDGTSIFPAVETVAKLTRQSERTVQYHLRSMQESGWLLLVGNAKGGRKKSREYRINPLWIETGKLPEKGANSAPFFNPVDGAENGATAIAPFDPEKGATSDTKGCKPEHERVQSGTGKGATAIAPNPSVPVKDPSENRGARSKTEKTMTPFEQFWAAWPNTERRVGKADCQRRWRRHSLDAIAAEIIAHVEAMKPTKSWREGFEPAPATYLNQRRWEDGVPPEVPQADGGSTAGPDEPWYRRWSGIAEKGAQVFRPFKEGEDALRYKVNVFKRAGEGKWRDELMSDLQRNKNSLFADIHQYIYGHPPVEVQE